MLASLVRGVGRLLLFLAKMALFLGATLFLVGASIVALPLMRLSPQRRRWQAGVQFATAGMALLAVYADNELLSRSPATPDDDTIEDEEDVIPLSDSWECPRNGGECFNSDCNAGRNCTGIWMAADSSIHHG